MRRSCVLLGSAMLSDIERLGYKEVILKCDGEPAVKSVQEEVKERRMDPTTLKTQSLEIVEVPGQRGREVRARKTEGEAFQQAHCGVR